MQELNYIIIPPLCWLLFALGGFRQKAWRRFGIPALLGIFCWINHIALWKILLVVTISCIVLHLGYGEGKSWLWRAFVGVSYGCIALPLGFSMWQVILPVMWIILFWLSNTKFAEKIVVWKIVEGFTGLLIGLSVAYLL